MVKLPSILALLLLAATLRADPLPASVYSDLASTKRTVTIPAGRWSISAGREVRVRRSDLTINAHGAVLVPDSDVTIPFWVLSTVNGGIIDGRRRADGVVTPKANTLTVGDTSGMRVGNVVQIRFGVNVTDPNDAEFVLYRKISAIAGNAVKFTPVFGRAATIYKSYKELGELSGDPSKCGPWGVMLGGHIGRGLGTSHDVICFQGGKPISNVAINGLAMEWPDDANGYGTCGVAVSSGINVVYRNYRTNNPAGSVIHLSNCERSGAEGVEITGTGRARWWSMESPITPAIGLSQWSGIDCFLRHVHADCENFYLTNFEGGIERATVENIYVRSGPQTYPATYLTYGDYRNLVLDLAPGTPILGTGAQVENLTLVRPEVPSWLSVARLSGTVRIGGRTFGPLTTIDLPLTASGYLRIPRPDGLYRSARIILESRKGIRSIGDPNDVLGSEGLDLPLKSSVWSSVRPGSIEEYYAALQCDVWTETGASVTLRFVADYLPERKN